VLFYIKNIGIAVGISLLSRIEAEIYVILYPLPDTGHLRHHKKCAWAPLPFGENRIQNVNPFRRYRAPAALAFPHVVYITKIRPLFEGEVFLIWLKVINFYLLLHIPTKINENLTEPWQYIVQITGVSILYPFSIFQINSNNLPHKVVHT